MSSGKARTCFACWPKRPQQLFYRYKKGALKRGHAFDLTFEQFMSFWGLPCTYCGEDIDTIGLDRRDNDLGYSTQNIVTCCYRRIAARHVPKAENTIPK